MKRRRRHVLSTLDAPPQSRLRADVQPFVVLGRIIDVQTIAAGRAIREIARLRRRYGHGHWLKRKGWARVRLLDGTICHAEIHWYEAHGIGRKDLKIKRFLEAD